MTIITYEIGQRDEASLAMRHPLWEHFVEYSNSENFFQDDKEWTWNFVKPYWQFFKEGAQRVACLSIKV